MLSLFLVGAGLLVGASLMNGECKVKEDSSLLKKDERKMYTKEVVRNNLSAWEYDDWECEQMAYELQDNWIRDDFESLMRRGYSFQRAIDKLVEENKLNKKRY